MLDSLLGLPDWLSILGCYWILMLICLLVQVGCVWCAMMNLWQCMNVVCAVAVLIWTAQGQLCCRCYIDSSWTLWNGGYLFLFFLLVLYRSQLYASLCEDVVKIQRRSIPLFEKYVQKMQEERKYSVDVDVSVVDSNVHTHTHTRTHTHTYQHFLLISRV